MKYITGFFQFWYDFIVGDDWTVAAVVVVALALTALLADAPRRGPRPRRLAVARRLEKID